MDTPFVYAPFWSCSKKKNVKNRLKLKCPRRISTLLDNFSRDVYFPAPFWGAPIPKEFFKAIF